MTLIVFSELDEKNVVAYYETGRVKDKLGNFYGALEDFYLSIAQENQYFDGYLTKGAKMKS